MRIILSAAYTLVLISAPSKEYSKAFFPIWKSVKKLAGFDSSTIEWKAVLDRYHEEIMTAEAVAKADFHNVFRKDLNILQNQDFPRKFACLKMLEEIYVVSETYSVPMSSGKEQNVFTALLAKEASNDLVKNIKRWRDLYKDLETQSNAIHLARTTFEKQCSKGLFQKVMTPEKIAELDELDKMLMQSHSAKFNNLKTQLETVSKGSSYDKNQFLYELEAFYDATVALKVKSSYKLTDTTVLLTNPTNVPAEVESFSLDGALMVAHAQYLAEKINDADKHAKSQDRH
jgi:hypothetical protein